MTTPPTHPYEASKTPSTCSFDDLNRRVQNLWSPSRSRQLHATIPCIHEPHANSEEAAMLQEAAAQCRLYEVLFPMTHSGEDRPLFLYMLRHTAQHVAQRQVTVVPAQWDDDVYYFVCNSRTEAQDVVVTVHRALGLPEIPELRLYQHSEHRIAPAS